MICITCALQRLERLSACRVRPVCQQACGEQVTMQTSKQGAPWFEARWYNHELR